MLVKRTFISEQLECYVDEQARRGEWLKAGPSPRATLPTRRKEPDYAWAPRGHTHTDGVPTVVLEVAVFNETEEELLAEGSEWLDLPTTQVRYNRTEYMGQ